MILLSSLTVNGNEFLGTEFQELLRLYGVQPIHATIKNPRANFVKRVHQTLGNMVRNYELVNFEIDYNDPWSQIQADCAWQIHSTVHRILDATPLQIVFGRDMLFSLSFTTN
jgi:hypothetical protein